MDKDPVLLLGLSGSVFIKLCLYIVLNSAMVVVVVPVKATWASSVIVDRTEF